MAPAIVSRLVPLVLLAASPRAVDGGFLDDLHKKVPGSIAVPIDLTQTSGNIIQAVKEKAQEVPAVVQAVKDKAAEAGTAADLVGVFNSTLAEPSRDGTQETVVDKLTRDFPEAHQAAQEQVSGALQAAGDMLQDKAEEVSHASVPDAEEVISNAEEVVSNVVGSEAVDQAKALHQELQKVTTEETVSTIKGQLPVVTNAASTASGAMDALKYHIAETANLVNQTGYELANWLGGTDAKGAASAPEISESSKVVVIVAAVVVLATCAACFVVAGKFSGPRQKEGLLSEALAMSSSASARTPSIRQPASEEASFMNF